MEIGIKSTMCTLMLTKRLADIVAGTADQPLDLLVMRQENLKCVGHGRVRDRQQLEQAIALGGVTRQVIPGAGPGQCQHAGAHLENLDTDHAAALAALPWEAK
jgi:hypothetical protein